MKKRILSGIRPTGKLHLGHWVGVLSNWVKLQDEYECFFMVADWHALMSEYKSPAYIKETIADNVADWLAWGIDPKKSIIEILSKDADIGENKSKIEAKIKGEKVEAIFNYCYLLDGLNNIYSDKITMGLNDSVKPVLIKPVGDVSYSYVVMPIKI